MQIESEIDISLIANKIINSIQQPCSLEGQEIVISPSIGISIYPKDGDSSETLIKSADMAMYAAKRKKSGFSYA
jgi:GGDEF domain-containing protein